jgi:heavy metal sensor kinase
MSFFNSMRWQLQLWYGVFLIIVLIAFGVTAYEVERGTRLHNVDEQLQHRLEAIDESLRAPAGGRGRRQGPPPESDPRGPNAPFPEEPAGPPNESRKGMRTEQAAFANPPNEFRLLPRFTGLFDTDNSGFYYAVWSRTGAALAISSNAPAGLKPVKNGRPEPNAVTREHYRELLRTTPPGEMMIVGRSINAEIADLHKTAEKLALVAMGILAIGLLGGWWISSRAIRPIGQISDAAARIASGDLSRRIEQADTRSELGRLAAILNFTFARLEAAFNQQKQFTSDAAHELRTPVSVMLTQTQSTLARPRSAEEYRESVEACLRASKRMRALIESLLELAKFDAGTQQLQRVQFDLAQVAEDCVATVQPLAIEKAISLDAVLASAPCECDPQSMSQVITNLMTNAIYYNKEGGRVRVSTESQNGSAFIRVSDTGIGIPAEHLPNIFKRFYRVDASRTSPRSGLGLAIAKSLVEAQGGSIEVSSVPGEGSTFTVRLPRA